MGDKVKGRLPILSENEGTVIVTVRSHSGTAMSQLLIQVTYTPTSRRRRLWTFGSHTEIVGGARLGYPGQVRHASHVQGDRGHGGLRSRVL
jgi:hypothetical protein